MKLIKKLSVVLAFTALFAPLVPLRAEPHLVTDLNTGPNAAPQSVGFRSAAVDPRRQVVYFNGADPDHGTELWRSDGTTEGTFRLTDVCPGRCDSDPGAVTVVEGRLFFTADDGFAGRELWQSDGSPGGERRVRDLCPGPCGSSIRWMAELGNRLLFIVSDGQRQVLWSTNGSRRGTVPVTTLCTSPPGRDCLGFWGPQAIGGAVFFPILVAPATDPPHFDLWRSDGTAAGTRPLREIVAGDGVPDDFLDTGQVLSLGDHGFFWTPAALWRTDGTAAGTVRVKARQDLLQTAGEDSFPYQLAAWNGDLYSFFTGGEVVRSDGTPAGTMRIAQLPSEDLVARVAVATSGLFFLVINKQDFPDQIWQTAGTAETTREVLDVFPRYLSGNSFAAVAGRALFAVSTDGSTTDGGMDLWSTDGTAAGSRRIARHAQSFFGTDFAAVNGRAVFASGADGASEEIWSSDGTAPGTRRVRNFTTALPGSGGPLAQTVLGGRLLYPARTSPGAPTLVASDGTAAGTRPLAAEATWPGHLTRAGGRVFFTAGEPESADVSRNTFVRRSLWWTDGTAQGTARIVPLLYEAGSFSALGSQLLFAARSQPSWYDGSGTELWSSNGLPRATHQLADLDPFDVAGPHHSCSGESADPGPGLAVGNALLFAADDGVHGRELWRSDGTAAGTRLVRDLNPGRVPRPPDSEECNSRRDAGLGSDPADFLPFRGGALFTADDGTAGRELWWTDGTFARTRRVADLRQGPAGSAPHDLTPFHGLVYFFASTDAAGTAGEALWRTDGTAAGTVRVDDLTVGGTPTWGRSLTATRDRLFFSAYNEATGAELWTSRGDAASTGLVADLRPGAPGSSPQDLTAVGDVLVFAADDGVHGLEPWRSDGTAAGTRLLGDINPGRDASSPGPFSIVGNALLTSADDGEHGRELWAIPIGDIAICITRPAS